MNDLLPRYSGEVVWPRSQAVDLRQCLGHLGVVPDAPALTLIAFF